MRWMAAAAAVAACVAVSFAVNAEENGAARPIGVLVASTAIGAPHGGKQDQGKKPGETAPVTDSCRWAYDNECDEPVIGSGACTSGTDTSDCRRLHAGSDDDSCRWAHDRECDEPRLGTGACAQGTDLSDCGDLTSLRNQSDSCAAAFNGACDEPGGNGNGLCAPTTDRSDCRGRARPLTINDHFFGRDDRVLVSADELPWRYIGRLEMDSGVECSATLVARDVILTAANCLYAEGRLLPAGRFVSSTEGLSARFTAYLVSRRYNNRAHVTSSRVDGHDWALFRLDRPLGDELGFASVRDLIGEGRSPALAVDLMQAGYAWDTGRNLAGNLRCRMAAIYSANTFSHECDTTNGGAGSAFFVANGSGFDIVGVDSKFRTNPEDPVRYIAVGAASFQAHVGPFVEGRTGRAIR